MEAATEPRSLRWIDDGTFEVEWEDGHASRFVLDYLRLNCPCAGCAGYGQRVLKELDAASPRRERVPPVQLFPVGDYAIGIRFEDGHADGIFSYRFLRSVCTCDACRTERMADARNRSA